MGFEPMISAGEQPQTYALDCAATGTGIQHDLPYTKLSQEIFEHFILSLFFTK
jgi:hypothetical protein